MDRRLRFLRVFILQRTQLSTFSFPRSAQISVTCPPRSDDCNSLRISGVWKSQFSTSPCSPFPGVLSPRAHDRLTCVLLQIDGPRLLLLFGGSSLSTNMSHHCMPFNLWGHASTVWSNPLFTPQFS
jgi:hypothetical protein